MRFRNDRKSSSTTENILALPEDRWSMTAKEITVEVCTKTSGSLARRVRIGITCVTISCGSAQSHKPWDYLRVLLYLVDLRSHTNPGIIYG